VSDATATMKGSPLFYYIAIALTGAIVLGVEVLASRIQMPYFGVSLYIWASILTITLICLALGYFHGGRLTRQQSAQELRFTFGTYIGYGSIALSCAALAYAYVFPWLATLDLVAGSFLACIFLMGVPLILFSALNPIVMVLVRADSQGAGDAGAGMVFFVSTLGSVLGVLITAFIFIPLFSNTVGLELFALAAALIATASTVKGMPISQKQRKEAAIAFAAVLVSVGALVYDLGFPKTTFVDKQGQTWNILDERHSIFGTIKVVEVGTGEEMNRLYLSDGLIQGQIRHDGSGANLFTYFIEILLRQFAADSKRTLFLGLAAGIVPRNFDTKIHGTEIVEINHDSLGVARQYFGFDNQDYTVHIQDARTFINKCENKYDAIVFDMFNGDGVPEYLLSREFFAQVRRCGTSDAIVVMNLFEHKDELAVRNAILSTVHTAFPLIVYFADDDTGSDLRNGFILASTTEPKYTPLRDFVVPEYLAGQIKSLLRNGQLIEKDDYLHAQPLTDTHNVYSVISAGLNIRFRSALHKQFPRELFKS
jgi:spermidine synthase